MVEVSGCMSPSQISLSRLIPSQMYSCIFRCTVYAPVIQMSLSLWSLQLKEPS